MGLHASDGEGPSFVFKVELLGLGERFGFLAEKGITRNDAVNGLVAQTCHQVVLEVLADAGKVQDD